MPKKSPATPTVRAARNRAGYVRRSKTHPWRHQYRHALSGIASGRYPVPLKVGPNTSRWNCAKLEDASSNSKGTVPATRDFVILNARRTVASQWEAVKALPSFSKFIEAIMSIYSEQTPHVVVEFPPFGDAEFASRWLGAAADADRTLAGLRSANPDFNTAIEPVGLMNVVEFSWAAMDIIYHGKTAGLRSHSIY